MTSQYIGDNVSKSSVTRPTENSIFFLVCHVSCDVMDYLILTLAMTSQDIGDKVSKLSAQQDNMAAH